MIMSPGLRKVALTAHVTSSIGWFGAVSAFLALALVGMASQDRDLVRAAYLAMGLTTWFVIVPLAFVSLLTGVVSSLGTRWGLFRYYWVLMKLVITVLATLVLLVHTQPIDLLSGAAAKTAVLGTDLHAAQLEMVVASSLALVVLLVLTVLSVSKPRGMTPYGQRKQDEQRQRIAAGDSATDQAEGIVQEGAGNDVRAATVK
jgi:signal transduction histidine kinase